MITYFWERDKPKGLGGRGADCAAAIGEEGKGKMDDGSMEVRDLGR